MLKKLDDYNSELVSHLAEIVKDRLYFATVVDSNSQPKQTSNFHFFSIDDSLVYERFYLDFGPLNLAMMYHYCTKLDRKMKVKHTKKSIVHYTEKKFDKRVNAALLIGSYAIIYCHQTPEQVYKSLTGNLSPAFSSFRDAGIDKFELDLRDCLFAVHKAHKYKFLDFDTFDVNEYEYYERVENGDLNWILPRKILAFCGPHPRSKIENGYSMHNPEFYFSYFRKMNVTTIVRLNKKIYDAKCFTEHGFVHKDLFFVDGTSPSDAIMREFLQICENAKGAIAVHCKAGLGRTGTLIACYIMKHYRFTATEAIAWIRICRPGSIIGQQQQWLVDKEHNLWLQGQIHNILNRINNNNTVTKDVSDDVERRKTRRYQGTGSLKVGKALAKSSDKEEQADAETEEVEGDEEAMEGQAANNVHSILNQVTNLNLNNNNNNEDINSGLTQGDKLNRIKALRRQTLSASTGTIAGNDFRPHRRASSQPLRALPPSSTSSTTSVRNMSSTVTSVATRSTARGFSTTPGAAVRSISASPSNPRRSPRINQQSPPTVCKSSGTGPRSPATRSRMPR